MSQKPLWSASFLGICLSNCLQYINHFMLLSTLPIFVIETLRGREGEAGLVMALFLAGVIVSRPLVGKWIDHAEKKKVLFVSLGFFALTSALYFAAGNLHVLLLIRFLHGVALGVASTASTAIAFQIIPDDRKGEGVGYFTTFISLAMVLGPYIGLTIIAAYGFNVLFAACSALAIGALFTGNLAKVPRRSSVAEISSGGDLNAGLASVLNWKNFIEPNAVPVSLAGALVACAYGGITTFISIYARDLGMIQYAPYFFVVYALTIVISRPFVGLMLDRLGADIVVYPCIFLFAVGMIGLSRVETPASFLLMGAIVGLGCGSLFSSFQTIAISDSEQKGLSTATFYVLYDIGMGVGAVALGIVVSHCGYRFMYLISSVIVGLSAVVYYCLHQKKRVKAIRKEIRLR